MDEGKKFTEKTGIPLDTDIEEQIPVRKVVIDSIDEKAGTAKFSVKTVLEKQTVRYMNVPKSKYRCKDNEHTYRILAARKWLFGCTKCPFSRRVYPSTHTVDLTTGIIIHKATGRRI